MIFLSENNYQKPNFLTLVKKHEEYLNFETCIQSLGTK